MCLNITELAAPEKTGKFEEEDSSSEENSAAGAVAQSSLFSGSDSGVSEVSVCISHFLSE